MSQDSFTDLRMNSASETQEGFWPSFTDIMTVVVMIFLIAMVVLLVRNMELVNQLRSTMEAERIAAELARATGAEKESLSSELHRAEERVQRMQLEIMRLQDKDLRHQGLIAEQLRAISGLTNERDDLVQQAAQLNILRQNLEADVQRRQSQLSDALAQIDDRQIQLNVAQRTIATLEEGLDQLRDRYAASQQQTERLQQTIQAQRSDLEAARLQEQTTERRYLELSDEFDSLKVKYDKLVKPARSSSGRHLIEVRYWKQDGAYRIEWREGNVSDFQPIRRDRLDKVLTRLAGQHANGLYVKVIFPENSGLSYNEAWEFTSHMHGNYDYYFKSKPRDTEPPDQQDVP
jgi:septal ring factor EnvC (AmiA/AmiB activator)